MAESENDELVEEFVDEDEAEATPQALKKLREKLKTAIAEKQLNLDGWQRARADFANFKREEASLNADRDERTKSDLIESMLPAMDVLELTLKHEDTLTLRMIEKQFLDSILKLGVVRFGKPGETFDPYRHEALAQKGEGTTIESVERSGYSIGDKIIRPAQVII